MPHLKVDFISYTLKRNVAINVMIPGLIADEIISGERTCCTVTGAIQARGNVIPALSDMRKNTVSR